MKKVMVIAPHPDDETLGCGGTLLKHKEQGDLLHWVIFTEMRETQGFTPHKIQTRQEEINKVAAMYDFKGVHQLGFPTSELDQVPMVEMVKKLGQIILEVRPEIIYLPYPGDIHTDHKYVFNAAASCIKWFRYDSIKKVLVYETISETDFSINPDLDGFKPNVFIDISPFLDQKIQIMRIYSSELGDFPFPRSEKTIQALATIRGAASGCLAAEAFMLVREIIN